MFAVTKDILFNNVIILKLFIQTVKTLHTIHKALSMLLKLVLKAAVLSKVGEIDTKYISSTSRSVKKD